MSNIVEADYTIVQERTLPVIVSEIKIIEQNVAKTAMEGAIQIGQRLQEAKEQVGHGNFETWCQENLNYNIRTARRFMKIADEYGGENGLLSNRTMLSGLSISNALSLLKVPEEDREKFMEEHPVEDMANRELEDEIRKLKEDKEQDVATIDNLNKVIERNKKETVQALHEAEDLRRQLDDAKSQAVDPEEIERMREKLRTAEVKAEKAKQSLKKEKEERQKEVDAAIEKERQGIIDEVNKEAADRMQQITGENDDLRQRLTETQEKLEKAAKGTIIQFKILTDQLQEIFSKCGTMVIEEKDPELSGKMNAALRQIVKAFEEAL